jgi:hypothetical protein
MTAVELLELPMFGKLRGEEQEARPLRFAWKESGVTCVADVERLLELELEHAKLMRESRIEMIQLLKQ